MIIFFCSKRSYLFEFEDFLRLRLDKSFSMVGSNNDLKLSVFKTGHQKTARTFGKIFLINNWS